jgi:uncharacterized iron-regulated membrane protein
MGTAWMDAQFVLDFYQTCLAVLVWLLATFACLTVLATAMFLWRERTTPSNRPASPPLRRPSEMGVRG